MAEQEAVRLAENGDFAEAAELLEGCLGEEHTGSEAESRRYEMLAQCYLALDQPIKAYVNALEATKQRPLWAPAYLTLARSARNAGYVEESVAAFTQAYRLDPDDEIKEERAEALGLRWKMMASRIDVEGLVIHESFGEGLGPGGVIWDSGISLVHDLKTADVNLKGLKVLELGSGTGLVGIVCAAFGAQVTLTDQVQLLPLMQRNVLLNQTLIQDNHGSCICEVLEWEKPASEVINGVWDLVLGADLVYSLNQIDALMHVLILLKDASPHCNFHIAHKSRDAAVDSVFFDRLEHLNMHFVSPKTDISDSSIVILYG